MLCANTHTVKKLYQLRVRMWFNVRLNAVNLDLHSPQGSAREKMFCCQQSGNKDVMEKSFKTSINPCRLLYRQQCYKKNLYFCVIFSAALRQQYTRQYTKYTKHKQRTLTGRLVGGFGGQHWVLVLGSSDQTSRSI